MGGTVFSYPARANRQANPYNALFSDALEARGWRMVDAGPGQSLTGKADIVHLHWPQAPMHQPPAVALRRGGMLLATLLSQKARGAKIVWTAHNVRSHDRTRWRRERRWMRLIVALLDGVVFLGEHSREKAYRAYPRLATLPSAVVPHGVYGDAYPPSPTKAEAREVWGLDGNRPVVGFVGDVKPYKGLHLLIEAFAIAAGDAATLFIAGKVPDDAYGASIREAVRAATEAGASVSLHDRRLDDRELVGALAASDLLAVPYEHGENSGLAVLAAERDVALLLPGRPDFDELAGALHPALAHRFDQLDEAVVLRAAEAARDAGGAASNDRLRAEFDWSRIADKVSALYERLRA